MHEDVDTAPAGPLIWADASYADALQWEALAQPVTLATEDLQEGLRARAEKREPTFTGR